ncbi:MAG: glycosyltransferase family 39 protein, partial [Acidobacteriota bacterium]
GPGWGMNYLVAGIYYLIGKNIFAAQSFCAVFGAATAPMIYFCAAQMFNNKRVAKISAISIAFFPSFVIWSSQLM